jgi:hypothetical protein
MEETTTEMEVSNTFPSELKLFTVCGNLFPIKKAQYKVLYIPKNYFNDIHRSGWLNRYVAFFAWVRKMSSSDLLGRWGGGDAVDYIAGGLDESYKFLEPNAGLKRGSNFMIISSQTF